METVNTVTVPETVAPARKTRLSYGVTDLEFAGIWETSPNVTEATKRLTELARSKGKITAEQSMSKNVVLARASLGRKAGMKLKKMDKRGGRRRDVAAVNAAIAALNTPPAA